MPLTRDVEAQKLIDGAARELEKIPELKSPDWSGFVKTGPHKERVPLQENWWHIRAASVLRKLYLGQAIGVSRLRKAYGGRKNRGHKPEHKCKASGAVIRNVLKQLEAAGLVDTEKGKGRKITQKGRKFLDSVAKGMK